jgi:catechol 2,3-dioxygenase
MDFPRELPITPYTVDLNALSSDDLAEFYAGTLGLVEMADERGVRSFGTGDTPMVTVTPAAVRHAQASPGTGLYHLAILVPSRLDLACILRRLLEREVPLQGAADHGVSEALYLADPEGNGVEICADRSPEDWPRRGAELDMPWDGMPAGTRLGHVHLKVSDLERAEAFYRNVVGFDLMLHFGDSASFLSTGGYHHHVGLNTWESLGQAAPEQGAPGLRQVTFAVDSAARLHSIEARAAAAGLSARLHDGRLEVTDPSGIQIALAIRAETGLIAGRQMESARKLEGLHPAP